MKDIPLSVYKTVQKAKLAICCKPTAKFGYSMALLPKGTMTKSTQK